MVGGRDTASEKQMEQLMDQYGEEIKRLVFLYVKDHTAAEDVTQEIFLTVYLKWNTYAGNSSIKTWIYSIAINKCKDYLRSWHVRKISVQANIMDVIRATKRSPADELLVSENSKEIVSAIFRLSIKYREVVLLFYYKELSVKEISEILGVSESTVKVRLHRGREKLRVPLDFLKRGEKNE